MIGTLATFFGPRALKAVISALVTGTATAGATVMATCDLESLALQYGGPAGAALFSWAMTYWVRNRT